jgi:3,4-dihydroxy 2-butanone 4-phosphate synthase/GTP cyclohydrolase II
VTTGISAQDRCHTIKTAIDPSTQPSDLVVPGHVFPLKAKDGGVLERAGHTEGSVDLARLAGLDPSAVICEIMNEDGTMARLPDLKIFAEKHDLCIVSIAELIQFRLDQESLIYEVLHKQINHADLGALNVKIFECVLDKSLHLAFYCDGFDPDQVVDVKVVRDKLFLEALNTFITGHSPHFSGLQLLREATNAVTLYLQFEQTDIIEHWMTHMSSDPPFSLKAPSSPMDPRLYGIGAQILRALGIHKMRLHAAHKKTLKALSGFGLELVDQVIDERPL